MEAYGNDLIIPRYEWRDSGSNENLGKDSRAPSQ
jgi:hypothetical protein